MQNNNKIIYFLIAVILIQGVFLAASCQRKVAISRKSEQILKRRIREPERVAPTAARKEINLPPVPVKVGKIAIVLDDWGYSLNNLSILDGVGEPLTLAILPNLPFSKIIAEKAKVMNYEVILHLPLEPQNEEHYHLENNTILTEMSRTQVLKILDEDIKSVPYLSGINNHMGSKATEDGNLMNIIMVELKKRNLYFLDSFTGKPGGDGGQPNSRSHKTVCREAALAQDVPYGRRDVFLDNKNNAEYINSQVESLARVAKQKGYAVGIGHCRKTTLEVLAAQIPSLKKRGFEFVYMSELVK